MFNKIVLLLFTFSITTTTFAQTFLYPPQKQGTTYTNSAQGPDMTVISPSDFDAEISRISNQKETDFDRQFNQKLSQIIAPTTPKPAAPFGQPPMTQPSPTIVSTPPTTTSPAPPAHQQVYTGFSGSTTETTGNNNGTSSGTGSSTTPPQKSSNVWTIHY